MELSERDTKADRDNQPIPVAVQDLRSLLSGFQKLTDAYRIRLGPVLADSPVAELVARSDRDVDESHSPMAKDLNELAQSFRSVLSDFERTYERIEV